jgi:hypothetical protein
MSTQPATNVRHTQIVPLEEIYKEVQLGSRWEYLIAEADTMNFDSALVEKFRTRYQACQCAIGVRSLIVSRGLPLFVKRKQREVFIWKRRQ